MKATNLKELLDSKEFNIYQGETILNLQWQILNGNKSNNEIDGIIECQEQGNFGLTHSEFIENWRDFLNTLYVFDPTFDDIEDYLDGKYDLHQNIYDKIMKEIEECENYHIKQNTINDEI